MARRRSSSRSKRRRQSIGQHHVSAKPICHRKQALLPRQRGWHQGVLRPRCAQTSARYPDTDVSARQRSGPACSPRRAEGGRPVKALRLCQQGHWARSLLWAHALLTCLDASAASVGWRSSSRSSLQVYQATAPRPANPTESRTRRGTPVAKVALSGPILGAGSSTQCDAAGHIALTGEWGSEAGILRGEPRRADWSGSPGRYGRRIRLEASTT